MRKPISVSHTKHSYRVTFECPELNVTKTILLGTEDAEAAYQESLNLLAYARYHYVEELPGVDGLTKESDWVLLAIHVHDGESWKWADSIHLGRRSFGIGR